MSTSPTDVVADRFDEALRMQPTNEVTDKRYPYGTFYALLAETATRTLDVREGLRAGWIVVQSFGRTAGHASDHAEAVRSALLGVRLVIDGADCTPIESQLRPAVNRDPDDDGVVTVTATYTFHKEPAR